MRNLIFYSFITLAFFSCTKPNPTFEQSQISIVPKPVHLVLEQGSFKIESNSSISIDNDEQQMAANYLKDLFTAAANFDLNIKKSNTNATIIFEKVEGLKNEEYLLNVTPTNIIIKASTAAGYFYGVQTLRQLLPPEIEVKTSNQNEWLVPAVSIEDSPRFKWRGMHMDFSRHFFSLAEVKTFLDYMVLYKMNTYHMHLTDDQGWRVEIKKYPLLTEKGAWRTESKHDIQCNELAKTNPSYIIDEQHFHEKNGQKMYGGFFTQEQIKDIIKYASDRNIEVVPEIDMPGHFKSAIDNYPFLSCTNEAGWGDHFSRPACLGKQSSYDFVKDILNEITDLFPSQYVHIGGDEVNIKSWEECANCQKAIKTNHLNNEHELQSFFNRDIEQFLKSKGKKLIGWDEIVEGGLSKDVTMMWWRNWAPKARYIAVDNGSDMVITPDFEYYFDFTNESTPLEKVYKYEPIPEDFTKQQAKHVLGVQANLWSERIPNFKRLQYQTFPRLLGIAETGWTQKESKNYEGFQERLQLQYSRLQKLNINYYIPAINGLPNKIGFIDKTTITLKAPIIGMEIFYTLDGSTPTNNSVKYTGPIEISKEGIIKVIGYNGNISSEIKSAIIEKQKLRQAKNIKPIEGALNLWGLENKFKVVEDIKIPTDAVWNPTQKIDLGAYAELKKFSLVFKGYFKAEDEGLFIFETKSDDGSLLYIGDKLVVDNGGNHAAISRDGMIALEKGWHPITIMYHQNGGGGELKTWVTTPNGDKKEIDKNVIAY